MTNAKQLRLDCPKATCTGTIIVDAEQVGSVLKCPVCGEAAKVSKNSSDRTWYLRNGTLVCALMEKELKRRLREGSIEPDVLLSRDERNWRPVTEYVKGYVYRGKSPVVCDEAHVAASRFHKEKGPEHQANSVSNGRSEVHDFLSSLSSSSIAETQVPATTGILPEDSLDETSLHEQKLAAETLPRVRWYSLRLSAWILAVSAPMFGGAWIDVRRSAGAMRPLIEKVQRGEAIDFGEGFLLHSFVQKLQLERFSFALFFISGLVYFVSMKRVWGFVIDYSRALGLTPSFQTSNQAFWPLWIPLFNLYWITRFNNIAPDINAIITKCDITYKAILKPRGVYIVTACSLVYFFAPFVLLPTLSMLDDDIHIALGVIAGIAFGVSNLCFGYQIHSCIRYFSEWSRASTPGAPKRRI